MMRALQLDDGEGSLAGAAQLPNTAFIANDAECRSCCLAGRALGTIGLSKRELLHWTHDRNRGRFERALADLQGSVAFQRRGGLRYVVRFGDSSHGARV